MPAHAPAEDHYLAKLGREITDRERALAEAVAEVLESLTGTQRRRALLKAEYGHDDGKLAEMEGVARPVFIRSLRGARAKAKPLESFVRYRPDKREWPSRLVPPGRTTRYSAVTVRRLDGDGEAKRSPTPKEWDLIERLGFKGKIVRPQADRWAHYNPSEQGSVSSVA